MEKDLYYLMENPDSPNKELRIFKNKEDECFCEKLSIHDARKINVSEPKTEREMRFLCADIGKKVCGICIAELYGDYD